MCHLLLLMPLLGLALFWIWPLAIAAPVYAVILALSVWLYRLIIRSMHKPLMLGRASLLHKHGVVVDAGRGELRVRVLSEVWQAHSDQPLHPGDPVEVVGTEGLVLEVSGTHSRHEGRA